MLILTKITRFNWIINGYTVFDVVKSPKTTVTLPNSEGGLDKSDFYFINIYFLQKLGIKIWVIKFFVMTILKIIHILIQTIEITSELSDPVVMQ